MKRFYKYSTLTECRYYSNLKKLCELEKLNYTNVHYSILRLKNNVWSGDGCEVELLYFSGV